MPASWWCHSTGSSPSPAPIGWWSISRPWVEQEVEFLSPSRCRRAATCSRSVASPARRSTTRSMPGSLEGVKKYPQFKMANTVEGRLGSNNGPKGRHHGATVPAADRRRRGPGWRWLRGRPSLQHRRPSDAADHHGQPPGRAAMVEGTEGGQRLYDLVRLDRARASRPWPSGSPSRCSTAARTCRTTSRPLPGIHAGQFRVPPCPRSRSVGVASAEYTLDDAKKAIDANVKK